MTTRKKSGDVSFIESLLKFRSIGTNFQRTPFLRNKDTNGKKIEVALETKPVPDEPDVGIKDEADESKLISEGNSSPFSYPGSISTPTSRSSSSKHSTPRTPVKRIKSIPRYREGQASDKEETGKRLAADFEVIPEPAVERMFCPKPVPRGHCACHLRSETQLNPVPKYSSKLISNFYYARPPPPILVVICCEQIMDELIDLTQSTISMVQSLKREL